MGPKAKSTRQRFSRAVSTLAESRGRIKERLLDAYRLNLLPGSAEDTGLSPSIGQRLDALHKRMTSRSAPDDAARVVATVQAMSEQEAAEVAREIVYLAWEITNDVSGKGA